MRNAGETYRQHVSTCTACAAAFAGGTFWCKIGRELARPAFPRSSKPVQPVTLKAQRGGRGA